MFSHSFRIKLLECSVLQCCHHLECSVLQCCHHLCSRLFCVRDLNCLDSTILYVQEPKGKSERERGSQTKMILDGWKGDPWALSLASGQINCCWSQKISLLNIFSNQNPGVQSAWRPNHCFSTIPIHLIHPQNDFGWLGMGSMGSKPCIRLVYGCSWM